jgi:hypothetical protein
LKAKTRILSDCCESYKQQVAELETVIDELRGSFGSLRRVKWMSVNFEWPTTIEKGKAAGEEETIASLIREVVCSHQARALNRVVKAIIRQHDFTVHLRALDLVKGQLVASDGLKAKPVAGSLVTTQQVANTLHLLRNKPEAFTAMFEEGEGDYKATHSVASTEHLVVLRTESGISIDLVAVCATPDPQCPLKCREYEAPIGGQPQRCLLLGVRVDPRTLLVVHDLVKRIDEDASIQASNMNAMLSTPFAAWTQLSKRNNYAYIRVQADRVDRPTKILDFALAELPPREASSQLSTVKERRTAKCLALLWLSSDVLQLYEVTTNARSLAAYDSNVVAPLKANDNTRLLRRLDLLVLVQAVDGQRAGDDDVRDDIARHAGNAATVNSENFERVLEQEPAELHNQKKLRRTVDFLPEETSEHGLCFRVSKQRGCGLIQSGSHEVQFDARLKLKNLAVSKDRTRSGYRAALTLKRTTH